MKLKRFLFGAMACFTVFATVGMTACSNSGDGAEVCNHTLTRVEHSDSSCTEEGAIAHYICNSCGKMFFDDKAKIELSADNVAIAKIDHSLAHYTATQTVAEYWNCFVCGKYFTDEEAQTETTYKSLFADAFNPVKLADVTTGDIYKSGGENAPLYDDFTFRCFISWTNDEGKGLDEFPVAGKVQVNINLNRDGAGNRVDWYNFGIGYSKGAGLFYKPLASGSNMAASAALTKLFLEQGGIYVVVVRDGGAVSAYLEDADGNLHLITSNNNFGADEAVVRLAANKADGVDGWTSSVTKTAICVGVADIKCIFDKAYE